MILRRALLALALLAGPVQAGAQADSPADPWRAALESLQRDDRRLQSIGWRLATGNAAFCADAGPAIGLLLQDMAAYGNQREMRRAAGIGGELAVQAVAAGSPAEQAGLDANDEILAIGPHSTAALEPASEAAWQRLAHWHDILEQELAGDGAVTLRWRDARGMHEAEIRGLPACRSRFELLDGGKEAAADGRRVVFGRDFVAFDYAEDELAAAVAHELAHNILRHRAWLDERGRKRRNIRRTEREADRLMPWLLGNAGYDPGAASRFMRKFGPRGLKGLFHDRTHDGWDERLEFIDAEVPQVRALLERDGRADWSRHFRREIASQSNE